MLTVQIGPPAEILSKPVRKLDSRSLSGSACCLDSVSGCLCCELVPSSPATVCKSKVNALAEGMKEQVS
jgi:hypothetical protein